MQIKTGQEFLNEISELQCIIAARHLSSGWECLVFEDKDEFVWHMSEKYEFEFESGDTSHWECIMMDELPDELDDLLSKHAYVSGWRFYGNDYEFSEDHDDINEFDLIKDQFLNGGENVEFGNIFTMKDLIENTDLRYNSILSKALMTMLDEGIDFEFRSEKYIEVQ